MSKIKSNIKLLIPPIILNKISGIFYGWSGNYSTWEKANSKCTGYESEIIFNKVKDALLKVKKGEAVYERDSVLFDQVQYSFPLLAALTQVAFKSQGKLNIVDFGGSMGSSYYQNRHLFKELNEFNWCIVEQPHFVNEGKKTFADETLHFFHDIESCLNKYPANVILLSSVLQYIEKPYELVKEIISLNIEYIIIDRAPVLLIGNDKITIQTVPRNIYKAKYPCWLLNEKHMLQSFFKGYDLVFSGESNESINVSNAAFKSYFLKRKSNKQ
jgi:putative methyltransferase (TIGR04325 family)